MNAKATVTKDTVMDKIMEKYGPEVVKEMLGIKLDGNICMNDLIEATEKWEESLQAIIYSMPFKDLIGTPAKAKRGPAKGTKKTAKKETKGKDNGETKKDTSKKFDVGPAEVQTYLRENVKTEEDAKAAKEIAMAMSGPYDVKSQDDAQAFFRRIRHVLGGLNKNDAVGVVGSGKGTKYFHKEQDSAQTEPPAEPVTEPVAVPSE